jgi:hypothetical protein
MDLDATTWTIFSTMEDHSTIQRDFTTSQMDCTTIAIDFIACELIILRL